MTFITVVQGKGCALLISDLQLLYCPNELLHLPHEQRPYQRYRTHKFRPNLYGDYIAFHGKMNGEEGEMFHKATLKSLENRGLQEGKFRHDNVAILFYAKKSTGQVYQGTSDSKLTPMQVGQAAATCTTEEFSWQLLDILRDQINAQKLNSDGLRKLSDITQEFYLDREKHVNTFGGFVSHILRPNEFVLYREVPGKLEECPKAEVIM